LVGDEAGLKVVISKYLQNKEELNNIKLYKGRVRNGSAVLILELQSAAIN